MGTRVLLPSSARHGRAVTGFLLNEVSRVRMLAFRQHCRRNRAVDVVLTEDVANDMEKIKTGPIWVGVGLDPADENILAIRQDVAAEQGLVCRR